MPFFNLKLSFLSEHEDELEEEAEAEEAAAAPIEAESSKPEKDKWKSQGSSRRSTYSDGQSRTPSRSPTPRRRSDDEVKSSLNLKLQ